ncbi:DUF659 domain-containing protein [Aphis craccivora]|uniref:DUF659 domain-containing protein n=1 Tax=Aphis craccivora TaxID=307492 RepID=A0A6G0ZHN3_APHCR|nr:DUF659 domain-containing protein [Aphis craccivora]
MFRKYTINTTTYYYTWLKHKIFYSTSTSADLVFIHLNNGFLANAILKLQNQGLSTVDNAFCKIEISVRKSSGK